MKEITSFIGFRCNLTVEDISFYNTKYVDNKESRNDLFAEFFTELKQKQILETNYKKRKYILIYKNDYDDIIHCQIARKREVEINELKGISINSKKEDDFPYVNIFIDLPSQKILIEVCLTVFENAETCKKIIENIMRNYFKYRDILIDINPITEEQEFWDLINTKEKIYKISFELNIPNWGDGINAAKEFAEDTKKLGSDKTILTINNKDGNIYADKDVIGSFIQYISEGAGKWETTTNGNNNRKMKISSGIKKKKVSIELDKSKINEMINRLEIELIKEAFNKIETVESLKR